LTNIIKVKNGMGGIFDEGPPLIIIIVSKCKQTKT
jgi:hypothetical protein